MSEPEKWRYWITQRTVIAVLLFCSIMFLCFLIDQSR